MKFFTKLILFGALFAAVLLNGCAETEIYNLENVRIIKREITERGLKLTFRPKNESAYYCPGVIFEQQGEKIIFDFVKSSINRQDFEIHLPAVMELNGNLSVTFPIPKENDKFSLVTSAGDIIGEWEKSKK